MERQVREGCHHPAHRRQTLVAAQAILQLARFSLVCQKNDLPVTTFKGAGIHAQALAVGERYLVTVIPAGRKSTSDHIAPASPG